MTKSPNGILIKYNFLRITSSTSPATDSDPLLSPTYERKRVGGREKDSTSWQLLKLTNY